MRVALLFLAAGICSTFPLVEASSYVSHKNPERAKIMQLVAKEARNMRVPTALALAVAKVESNFDAKARSHKGARGVMQIMPKTARGEYGIAPRLLWDPRINVRLGLHFLRRLLDRYNGRVDLALSYYNGGSAVGDLPNARVIPATRKYVNKVQKAKKAFRRELIRARPYKGRYIEYDDTGKLIIKRGAKRRTTFLLPGYSRNNNK